MEWRGTGKMGRCPEMHGAGQDSWVDQGVPENGELSESGPTELGLSLEAEEGSLTQK